MNEHGCALDKRRLFALVSLLTNACWDPPPTYEEQERIPPFVVVPSVKPALDEVVRANATATIDIYVPFRSEDLGEDLIAAFGLDGTFLGRDSIGASVFEDTSRKVEFAVPLEVDPGCYQLSMVLTHDENYQVGLQVNDESRAAFLYWWVDVFDPRVASSGSCPDEGS